MKLVLALAAALVSSSTMADVYVNGYMRSDGVYVAPHYRTAPDSTLLNNYSTRGNVNPYTGQAGYVNPYAVKPQPVYTPNVGVRPYQVQPYQPYSYNPYGR